MGANDTHEVVNLKAWGIVYIREHEALQHTKYKLRVSWL